MRVRVVCVAMAALAGACARTPIDVLTETGGAAGATDTGAAAAGGVGAAGRFDFTPGSGSPVAPVAGPGMSSEPGPGFPGAAPPPPPPGGTPPSGVMGPSPVLCGEGACPPIDPLLLTLGLPECCTDAGQCGVQWSIPQVQGQSCVALGQPGTPDARCPDEVAPTLVGLDVFLTLEGCCKPSGACGLSQPSFIGLGCVERSELGSLLGASYDPLPCDRGADEDAGT